MKKTIPRILSIGTLLSAAIAQAALGSIDFMSYIGSTIQFNGTKSSLQFNNSFDLDLHFNPYQWVSSNGKFVGSFTPDSGVAWTYGTITIDGNRESANVFGTGLLRIEDLNAVYFTGTVNWVNVATLNYVGYINAVAAINLSDLQYLGTDPELVALRDAGKGSVSVSFQFSPGKTLTELTEGKGPYKTSYNGSISPVPEASTAFAGLGALGVVVLFIAVHSKRSRLAPASR